MATLGWIALVVVVLYFLAIMPRMIRRPDRSIFRQTLFAHRGLHDNRTQAPENSMAAFRRAVEAGYGIEMDVQLSKDGVPVVFHDYLLRRVCGQKGRVCDYTLEELERFRLCQSEERIPTFAQVLQMVDGRVPLIVELKGESPDMSVCRAADAVLRSYHGVYCIESFNPLMLWWYRRNRGDVMRGQLSDNFFLYPQYRNRKGLCLILLQFLLTNFLTKPDFIAYNHECKNNLSRRLCHGLYRSTAAAWTIRSGEELAEARRSFDIFIFDSFLPEKLPEKRAQKA